MREVGILTLRQNATVWQLIRYVSFSLSSIRFYYSCYVSRFVEQFDMRKLKSSLYVDIAYCCLTCLCFITGILSVEPHSDLLLFVLSHVSLCWNYILFNSLLLSHDHIKIQSSIWDESDLIPWLILVCTLCTYAHLELVCLCIVFISMLLFQLY